MVRAVTSEDFDAHVLERSHERPVLVDFWAPWCGPCRAMAPLLEKLAAERGDTLDVVKLDTDENPDVATRYGIRGIPNLKIFRDGAVVGEQVGAVGYAELRAFVDRHAPSPADELVARGRSELAGGRRDAARGLFEQAVAIDPGHGAARLELARMAVADGDLAAYEAHLAAVAPAADEAEKIRNLRVFLELRETCERGGGLAATRQVVAEGPDEPDPWLAHGACLVAAGEYEAALEALLEAVVRTRPPHDSPAHRAMLAVFTELGHHHPAVDEYKRKLQIYL